MKSLIYFTTFLAVSAAADVRKIEVLGNLASLETDSNGTSYAVADYQNSDYLYVLDSTNNVIFTAEFGRIASVILNKQEEPYVLDYRVQNNTIQINTINRNTLEITLIADFTTPPGYHSWTFFFDNDDNLFFSSADGISILPKNEQNIVTVSNLDSDYHIATNNSYAVDPNGNVYIGVVIGDGHEYQSKVIIIEKDEIRKPNPTTYFINIDPEWVHSMIAFRDSIYIGSSKSLVQIVDDNQHLLLSDDFRFSDNFAVFKNRFYFRYVKTGDRSPCSFAFITPDNKIHNITGCKIEECYCEQAFDGSGNVFFADWTLNGNFFYILNKDDTACKAMSVPDEVQMRLIAATVNGDLWIYSGKIYNNSLYYIPRGSMVAVQVDGVPKDNTGWFMKAKLNADEVFIGTKNGLFVATS